MKTLFVILFSTFVAFGQQNTSYIGGIPTVNKWFHGYSAVDHTDSSKTESHFGTGNSYQVFTDYGWTNPSPAGYYYNSTWFKDFQLFSLPNAISVDFEYMSGKNVKNIYVFLSLQNDNVWVGYLIDDHPLPLNSTTVTLTWDMKMFRDYGMTTFNRIYFTLLYVSDSGYVGGSTKRRNLRGVYTDKTTVYDSFGGPLDVPKVHPIPNDFVLYQNYPNPFNPVTTIRYQLPVASQVSLKVYNLLGREVATLAYHKQKSAGIYEETFNASELSSGVYVYKLQTSSFIFSKKMTLVK